MTNIKRKIMAGEQKTSIFNHKESTDTINKSQRQINKNPDKIFTSKGILVLGIMLLSPTFHFATNRIIRFRHKEVYLITITKVNQ